MAAVEQAHPPVVSDLVQIGKVEFRFECRPGCTTCCTKEGDVFLTDEDVKRIAPHFDLSPQEFLARHCDQRDGETRLADKSSDPCRFVTETGCSIHEVKPLQCRTFPFWPEYVRARRSWRNLRRFCPGIGEGPIVPLEEIRREAQATKDAFPDG